MLILLSFYNLRAFDNLILFYKIKIIQNIIRRNNLMARQKATDDKEKTTVGITVRIDKNENRILSAILALKGRRYQVFFKVLLKILSVRITKKSEIYLILLNLLTLKTANNNFY